MCNQFAGETVTSRPSPKILDLIVTRLPYLARLPYLTRERLLFHAVARRRRKGNIESRPPAGQPKFGHECERDR